MIAKGQLMAVLALAVTAMVGCGEARKRPEIGPMLNTVGGDITLSSRDANLHDYDGAIVQLHPKGGAAADKKISGSVMEGNFVIQTEEAGNKIMGAPDGEYAITISPSNGGAQPVPAKYTDPATSGLTTVVKKGPNEMLKLTLNP